MTDSPWIQIETATDPRIELYRDLKDADLRKRGDRFMAEGELIVHKALQMHALGEIIMESVLVNPARLRAMEELLRPLAQAGLPVYLGAQEILDDITGFHVHRGCLSVGKCPPNKALNEVLPPDDEPSLIVVCEALRHVDNLGTIFRNAAAFGADAVILDPESCDPLYRRTLRVSIGHALRLPWSRQSNWPAGLRALQERGYTLVALALTDAAEPLQDYAWPERTAIVLGTEGPGLRWKTIDACDAVVKAPMHPGVDSLNVGTASGIALYAARYQQPVTSDKQ
jgi:tRNA G18 (ribose-2'-O)-methylase SpoU